MNLVKIQTKIDEFISSNNSDVLSSAEYVIYTANLLFGLAIPILAVDDKHHIVDPKDYYSVESAHMKDPDNPYLALLVVGHNLISVASSFQDV
jgi:hypothetical protein